MRKFFMLATVSLAVEAAFCAVTAHLAVDCRDVKWVSPEGAELFYDASWYADAEEIRITDNGTIVETGVAGSCSWRPDSGTAGQHILRLEAINNGRVVAAEAAEFACFCIRNETELVIPEGTTEIGDFAFAGGQFTSVTIPNSVTNISLTAFAGCDKIVDLALPIYSVAAWIGVKDTQWITDGTKNGSVVYRSNTIGDSQSTSIVYLIPVGVTVLDFSWKVSSESGYDKLTWYLDDIQQNAISGAVDWSRVNKDLDGAAHTVRFTYSKDGSVNSGSDCGWVAVSKSLGYDSSLLSGIFPDSYTNIQSVALTDGAVIPYAFCRGCEALESVSIPNSVTNIGEDAFAGCEKLSRVNIPSVADWLKIDFANEEANPLNTGAKLYVGGEEVTELVIPEGTTEIGDFAFAGGQFTSVTIPNSVTNIGENAFSGCEKLLRVNIPSVADWLKIDFANEWANPLKTGAKLYAGGEEVSELEIPEGATEIGDFAFAGGHFTSVTIPNSVTNVSPTAFAGCEKIVDVVCGNFGVEGGKLRQVEVLLQFDGDFFNAGARGGELVNNGGQFVSDRFGHEGRACYFNGQGHNAYFADSSLIRVEDTFTIAFWFKTDVSVSSHGSSSTAWNPGNYAFFPENSGSSSGFGVKVGTDGIQVCEHGSGYLPTVLNYTADIGSDWNHVAVAVENSGAIRLYLNGELVCTGNGSTRKRYAVPSGVGGGEWGYYTGAVDDVAVFNHAMTDDEVLKLMQMIGGASLAEVFCDSFTNICTVAINAGVAEVAAGFCDGCLSIETVTIPNSVTNIGENAFSGCEKLSRVNIPSVADWLKIDFANEEANPLKTGAKLYAGGVEVTELEIPEGTTEIGDYAFHGGQFTSVTIPNSVTNVSSTAFAGCEKIVDVTLPICSVTTKIGIEDPTLLNEIFPDSYANLQTVALTDGTVIPPAFFAGCDALTSVSIPAGVTNIDTTAFVGCGAIKEVEIAATNLWHEGGEPLNMATLFPDSVAGITDVAVDEGVLTLPDDFVEGCTSLETLALPASLEDFGDNDIRWFGEKVGKEGFWIENGWLLGYIGTAPENVVIPDGVKDIAGYAFEGQMGIETVEFPESLRYIGVGSFEGCVNLEGLELPEGLERIDDGAFKNCTWIQDVEFPSTLMRIGKSAFENCTSIYPGIVFNEGLKTIEESAFSNCWRMVSVAMPASVDEVGDGAFYDCRNLIGATIPTHVRPVAELFPSAYANLKSIVIAEGETNMTEDIFAGCAALPQIRILDTIPEISASAFYGCAALEKVLFDGEILAVGDDAFVGCSALQPPILPETVRSIGARAFKGLSQFSEFKFPASLMTIGAEAFSGCSGISAIELPRGLETLGEKAFYGMSKLTAANIPATVTSLGTAAFGGCGAIRSVSMPGGLLTASSVFPNSYRIISSATVTDGSPEICADLFNGCWQLAQVDLPTSVTNIGANAFLNCSALTAVGIPGGVRKLGTAAFKGCSSITSLSLPQGLTSIADETFYGCSSLGELVIPGSVTSLGARVFSGCNAMTSVSYVGNAPTYIDSSYSGSSAAMVSRVVLGTTGWDGVTGSKAIPEVWPVTNSRAIEYWDVITFDVSFYGNGGAPELAMVGQVTGLTYALPLEDPKRTGYAFAGWWTETRNGAQVKATDKVAATRPHNLYAHWTPNEYTVAFHANGGFGTMESVTLQYDAAATLTTCGFYRKNAEFAGWATEKDGPVVFADGVEVKNLSAEANALVTLYAVWTERIWSAADYLGCPGRPFVDSGDAPWVPDEEMFCSAPGSMRSGAIEAAEEYGRTESVLSTTVFGEGSGSFWWKVDCEPEDGGEYYDYALFEIDGVEVAKIAGHVNWTEVRFEVTGAGEHTLRWTFTRDDWDEDPSLYENAAWLDDFVFAPTPVMVAFDGNGATAGEVPSAIASSAGESVTLPDAGTLRNGAMLFEGWLDSDRGETYRGGDAYVVGVTNVTLKAAWSEHVWTLAEILGADNLTFMTDEGDAAWFGDFANTHDGKVALRSGAIGDSQMSRVTATFSGDGELAFWTRTDGEFNRGKMVDYLKVELDGELVFSGATNDWTRVVVPVSGLGEHTVVWTYLKNGSKSVGLDRAWLSEVVWMPQSVYPITYENLMGATNANPSVYHVGYAFDFAAPGPVVGYTFTGWSPASITDETKGAVTVTASWRANAYRIVYDANGGTGETLPSACVYDGPEVRAASCGFVRTDCNFLGWATTAAGDVAYSPGDVISDLDVADGTEIVFYAVWQPKYVYEDLTDETVAFVKMNDSVSTSYEVPSEFSGKTVVAIAAGAFAGDTALVDVVLPPTVTEIGEGAFAGCASLKSVCISGSGEIARVKALLESSGLDTSGIAFTEKTLRLASPVAVVNSNGVEAVVSVSVTAVYVPEARLALTLNGVEVKSWTGLSTGVYSENVSVVCGSTNVFEFVATEGGVSVSAMGTFVARTYVGWFDVRFEDEGFVEGSDWLARSVDRSGGHFVDVYDSFKLVKGERSYLCGSGRDRLRYVPSAPSETNAPVTVSGSALVRFNEEVPEVSGDFLAAFVFADGKAYGASSGDWVLLPSDDIVDGEWIDYEIRLDFSDADASRVQYVLGSSTSAWMRTWCNRRNVTSLEFYTAVVGDFKASYMSSQAGGEVIELVAPEFTSDGTAIGHSGSPGTADAVFSMTIANPIAGAYYTVYTAERLTDVFVAESGSTLFEGGDAVLTLVMSADTPSKFARIVVSRSPVEKGSQLK